MIKILVTGSRDWDEGQTIAKALREVHEQFLGYQITLISGACPTGADALAEAYVARHLGNWLIERHPADWAKYGKAAGFKRNRIMVNRKPDLCLAFIKDNSKGATHTLSLATQAGITTKVYRI